MKVKTLNDLEQFEGFEWSSRKPVEIKVLGHMPCVFMMTDFNHETDFEDYKAAMNNFITMKVRDFKETAQYLFQYYQDVLNNYCEGDDEIPKLKKPSDVWKHVSYSNEITVARRRKDEKVYVSIEGSCAWEREHGLQIVFCEGKNLVKVGPYNSHLRNSDVYAKPKLENVIYVS